MENPSHNLLTLRVMLMICFALCFVGTLSENAQVFHEDIEKLATANNDLALKIHRKLATESSENVLFSPFSLSTAFGMLYYGTKGKTAKELKRVLGYKAADLSDELVHKTFHAYLTKSLPSNDPSAYSLKFANAILFDKHLNMVSTYKKGVQCLYNASVTVEDFKSENSQVLNDVNSWVSEKTNGKINKLLEDLNQFAALIMLNAVYFKGTWENKFESNSTAPDTFFNNGLECESKKVPMMKMTAYLPYNDARGVQSVELPYEGKNISMIVLLPNDHDGIESMEKNLTLRKFSNIRQGMEITKVNLTFPKFKLEYSREMSSDFGSLGANEIFNPGADFSGMTSDRITVNEVVHKAVLEVNEEGSEAAGATGVTWGRHRPAVAKSVEVVANHPFMFVIIDNINDMILFMGRVTNL